MKKLILECTIGLVASGKSTYARDKCNKDSSWVELSKDDIRKQIRVRNNLSESAKVNEKEVLRIQDKFFIDAFSQGKNCISSDTNLNPIHINERLPKLLKDNNLEDKVEIVINKS